MSELETQEAPSMEDTLRATLDDIQSRGVDLEAEDTGTEETVGAQPAERVRDASGKFAPKTGEEETAPVETLDSPAEEQPISRKPPSSWRKEAQEKFSTLDPAIQEEIEKREQDFHKGLEPLRARAQIADMIEGALKPFEANLRAENANPVQAIQHFFSLDNTLRHGTQEQKAMVVQEIMARAGLTPELLSQAPQVDTNYQALQQQIRHLQSTFQQREQFSQQQEANQLNSEIDQFKQGKEHFETVRQDMAALLQAGRAQNLGDAYEMAIWANPQVRASLIAKQQEGQRAESSKKAQEAKKAAQVNIPRRGQMSPSTQTTGSMEDTIRAKARELGLFQ